MIYDATIAPFTEYLSAEDAELVDPTRIDAIAGGMLAALAEMIFPTLAATARGVRLVPVSGWDDGLGADAAHFAEYGGFIVETPDAAAFEAAVPDLYQQMAPITITASWTRFYDFGGAGRLPTFLRRLVEPGSA